MSERKALHEKFLTFFQLLEEQAELSKNTSSRQFEELAEILDVSKKTLVAYLRSEHNITFLEAFKFCKRYSLNTEEMFSHIPDYVQRISEENDLSIAPGFSVIAGNAAPSQITQNVDFSKIEGAHGQTMVLPVSGDSMIPHYNEGERVLLKKVFDYSEIKDNLTYVFALEDNSYKIKKVVRTHDENGQLKGFVFISNNAKYKKEYHELYDILTVYTILRKYPALENSTTTKSEKIRESLKNLIAQRSDIKKVLELLRSVYPKNNDIIVYQTLYLQNLRDYRKGEIDVSSRDKSNSRVITAILEFIDEMDQKVLEKIDDSYFE